ncbi:probetacellulin isoform X2 [Oryx dammah]|uniref:probetacellulin isoform X2 n=1 Tax=Oryx dammah TaxID=59534 RepID=UPI001A9B16B2|nr:probetacellulin isoform X2 [Oryx dammah]
MAARGISEVQDTEPYSLYLKSGVLYKVEKTFLEPSRSVISTTQPKRRGHFSRCPKQYKHYCIKGRCRFVVAEQTPSCVCDEGYAGARCERVDLFYLRGDRGQILVICLIAVMVIFIILVVSICTCCHPLRKRRKRRKKEEEMETLGKDITPINDDIQETSIA